MNEPPTLLAFGFLSPWILWGLMLGGVPILIQWLHRRNYTERVWAAMRFLRAATKSQSRRLRFESLLLLLIRTLILMLVALALAEPFLKSSGWLPEAESNVHRIIVIDASLSMGYESEGRSVGDRALDAARSLVAESRPGDSFQVVTIGREARALVRQAAFDPAEVLAEIDRLKGSEEFGDPGAALELVRELVEESPPRRQLQVNVVSDFQRSNWWPAPPTERTRMQQSLAELAQVAETSIVRVGVDEPVNAAVIDVQADPAVALVGMPVRVTATIRSSRPTVDGLPVELVENDRILQTEVVDVPAGDEVSVTFTILSRDPGPRRLEVRLPKDGLAADNHRWVALNVKSELNVLLVNGRESGEVLGRATDFVEVALSPVSPSDSSRLTGPPQLKGYRPVVVNEAEFTRTELADFDCVFLCDVPFLGESEFAQLDRFVRSGGGLIVGLGDQIQPDAYNQWTSAGGGRLLPAQLVQVRESGDASSEPFHFAEPTGRHPIVEPFFGNPQAGLTTANIYRFYETRLWADDTGQTELGRLVPQPDGDSMAGDEESEAAASGLSRVAVAFDAGDPAIVERDYGAGRILLVTTSLDDRWGSWALWPSFLPMVHRMVRHAIDTRGEREWIVGDRLSREYPLQTVGMLVNVQRPDGRRAPGRSTMQNGVTTAAFSQTPQSGIYRFVLGPPMNETETFAVNVDSRESDLRGLGVAELTSTLLRGVDAHVRMPGDTARRSPTALTPQTSLTKWLLILVLVLLMVEQVMAWNARYGIAALVASPLVIAGFAVAPRAATVILVAALGILFLRRRVALIRRL